MVFLASAFVYAFSVLLIGLDLLYWLWIVTPCSSCTMLHDLVKVSYGFEHRKEWNWRTQLLKDRLSTDSRTTLRLIRDNQGEMEAAQIVVDLFETHYIQEALQDYEAAERDNKTHEQRFEENEFCI
ncbi:hypothetical protein L596_009504 [Steinernema carpocapsae]|uniref:Uncharacterized protein n=1 Tax=Steinernema carpocapsae TaxID=34508 RepID=A0A4U5PFQ6_STECR|nr:hypothetical protein L596_009495 [Steinernema carpocapsae]TKR95318.1 hypothetical protein L596_009504 [Steinernema carpocapsae]